MPSADRGSQEGPRLSRRHAVSGALILAFAALGIVLPGLLGLEGTDALLALVADAKRHHYAFPATILMFVVLGLTIVPQFAMILVASILLGPLAGLAASWIGTMISALVGFYLGKFFGAPIVRRLPVKRVRELSEALGRHGILATVAVRNLPAGPFVTVNMIAGMSHMSPAKYMLGTALGSLPKMVAVSFFGASLFSLLMKGDPVHLALAAAVLGLWVGFMIWLRRVIPRSKALSEVAAAAGEDEPPPAPQPGGAEALAEPPKPALRPPLG